MKLSLISSRKPHFDPFSSVWTAMQACELANCAEIDALTVFTLKTIQNASKCRQNMRAEKIPGARAEKIPGCQLQEPPPLYSKSKEKPELFLLALQDGRSQTFPRKVRSSTTGRAWRLGGVCREEIETRFPLGDQLEAHIASNVFHCTQNHSFEWSVHCFSESRFIWISINVKQKSRKNDGPLCKNGAKTSQKFWHAIGAAAKMRRPVWDYIIHIYPKQDLSIFAPFRVLFSIFALIFAPPQKFCKKNLRLLKNALYF